ncbi:glycosyltransferase [Congregibacter brevis]|uniref:Glycosyltransferase n=1 Tax=Congregibacter brevis TaxID=3081201 RepID=A0ABZ0IH04_9GAMM|nr:glycosyltransferase [Congregibacter sp. IMCC45268]
MALCRNISKEVSCDLAVTVEQQAERLELVNEFRKQGLGSVFEVPMKHRFDFAVIDKLARIIVMERIQIIHTHGYKSDIVGLLAARRAGIPCVCTPHGFENSSDLKLKLFIWAGCKAMIRADRIVPLSQQLMLDSRAVGAPEEKLRYIQNGVDLSEVEEERLRPKIKTEKRRIGFVGQLISRKNVHDILDVFNTLHQDHSDIELVLLGDGNERAALEAYAYTLPSRDDIHFYGFRDDRLELLHSFELFVMTSTLEGIPRCLMEACAMGVAVAAYDIPGVDQLVKHNVTGLLAPLGDKSRLIELWRQALETPEHTSALARAARDFVNEQYSAARMAAEYCSLFKELRDEQ